MVPFVLVAVLALGLALALLGAGFLAFLCIAGSIGTGGYLAVKHPNMLKP